MGKRYYCDYCDRAFPDTADNRKKHISGVQHQRQRKIHYDRFRDAADILAEERVKKPCTRFRQNGYCDFGSVCRFSHLAPQDFALLEQQASYEKWVASVREQSSDATTIVNSWLNKVTKKQKETETIEDPDLVTLKNLLQADQWEFPLPSDLADFPQSLHPPASVTDFMSFSQWG